ncbi:MAG: hypothetical protein AB7V04_13420 [Desulfomonilaceae bacterium]
MDTGILKAFYLYGKDVKRTNNRFARKVDKIKALKDLYYAYALSLWDEKDELLKCSLALEIYGWIEEFEELTAQEKRNILLYVINVLSDSCLKEDVTNHALALTVIRGGIGDNVLERKLATEGLLQLIDSARKQSRYYFSKSLKSKHIMNPVDTIFYKIMMRLQDEELFYISLVDGSYWHDLSGIIFKTDAHIGSTLTDLIVKRQNVEESSTSDLRNEQMEYIRSTLAGLYKECAIEALTPRATINTLDKFGVGFAQYIEYVILITKIQMLMPSWIIFSNYKLEHKQIAFEHIFDKAPGSPLYWFCSFVLESNKVFSRLKNKENSEDMYGIIQLAFSNHINDRTHAIKFINTNLPTDTDETKMLKAEVWSLLEKRQLLSATVEYAYYLACLHEPLGLTEKRKSWFRKNINLIFDSYYIFLNILRRVFIALERRKKSSSDTSLSDFDYNDLQQKEIDQQILSESVIIWPTDHGSTIEQVKSDHKWQCLDTRLSIQGDPKNPQTITDINKDKALGQIDKYLEKLRIDSMITSRHILSTLDIYLGVDNLQRRNPVNEGGLRWTKIRRGKTRLLVRPTEDGLIFHVYKRNNYYHGKFE